MVCVCAPKHIARATIAGIESLLALTTKLCMPISPVFSKSFGSLQRTIEQQLRTIRCKATHLVNGSNVYNVESKPALASLTKQ